MVRTLSRHWLESYTVTAQFPFPARPGMYTYEHAFRGCFTCPDPIQANRFGDSSGSLPILRTGGRTATPSSRQLVEKKIEGGNPAVPGNDEVSPGVSWRFTRAARYPW